MLSNNSENRKVLHTLAMGRRLSCQLWNRVTLVLNALAYGVGLVKVRLPFTNGRRQIRVHVICYLAAHIEDRAIISGDRDFDISHRCCQSLCVSLSHLSREPRSVNNSRICCNSWKLCNGHGIYGDCIFPDVE